MQKFHVAIIGGGAAGMFCALRLAEAGVGKIAVMERNERLGRKLSVTGNGQGNISNENMSEEHYFSDSRARVRSVLDDFGKEELIGCLTSLGGLFLADGTGRIYPASRQASSVTDILRFALAEHGVTVFLNAYVRKVGKEGGVFVGCCGEERFSAEHLVVCCGGCAAPYLGTDGNGYAIAESFGHTVSPLFPALVQLKTDRAPIRGLKGVRTECRLQLQRAAGGSLDFFGDVIFTDYGISGNAVFRASSFAVAGDHACIDFLPSCSAPALGEILSVKAKRYPHLPAEDLLRCVVNSAVGKSILRACGIDQHAKICDIVEKIPSVVSAVKAFRIQITGTAGFENAQVTKGGVPLAELDDGLMSKKTENLYFAGEILNVDGECGGYNLQWAFSSGATVAKTIANKVKNADRSR